MIAHVNPDFWRNKRIFLTGHTGFKGGWLALWLQSMGADVKGYALPPASSPSLFLEAAVANGMESEFGDVRDLDAVQRSMVSYNPDILLHMAAQPLVRLSYAEPVATYATNVMGTVHVLEAARQCSALRAIVNVTTDKCYDNREWEWGYRECEPMGGHDPYSSSKGCSELITSAYRRSFFSGDSCAGIASARAGNVIGGGDWAQDRLIPDALKAFEQSRAAVIRNPAATRPWQHVLEPLSGYLVLAENLWQSRDVFADAWNFGPNDEDVRPVHWVMNKMTVLWGDNAQWEGDSTVHPHEAQSLKLDISKAKHRMGWHPLWTLEGTLQRIVDWHKAWLRKEDPRQLCLHDIHAYQNTWKKSA